MKGKPVISSMKNKYYYEAIRALGKVDDDIIWNE